MIITDQMREDFIRTNYVDNSKIEKLDEKTKDLLIDYDAKSSTYKEQDEPKELEKLDKKFKIEYSILTKKRATYQKEQDEFIKRSMYHQKVQHGDVSKMQYFMDVLKELEGDTKKPVEHVTLVRKLCFAGNNPTEYDVESGVFSREGANEMIKKMIREASIYESKPGHYNRV